MPVRDLVRGLSGALFALLATLVLVLCLAETRERFGRTEWGIWWLPIKSWIPHFSSVWYPLIVCGVTNIFAGYLLAGRLTTKRSVKFAFLGAAVAVGLAALSQSPLPRLYGQAGQNTVWLLFLFFALVGGYAGASIGEKVGRQRRGASRPVNKSSGSGSI
ncbi:MAG TPA: hypothetical protein VHR66_00530 [Gemmataceae bacterium]|jgi:hypothetical protein|nr:hypothetical protein [Gemmataceae bacterium]